VVPLTALAVAGCGGGSNNSTASSSPPKTASGGQATVGVQSSGSLGKVLVDSKGDTLYLFKKDSGTKSACTGACASAWPPLRASGKPTAGSGVNASMLGTAPRSDGKPQVTYNGHPLYNFTGDQNPGDTSGQGVSAFGALWYVVSPAGNQVTTKASGSSSSGGGGSGY
jgi:predicted lipoprotein with Yx(FWY)xxD motif